MQLASDSRALVRDRLRALPLELVRAALERSEFAPAVDEQAAEPDGKEREVEEHIRPDLLARAHPGIVDVVYDRAKHRQRKSEHRLAAVAVCGY